MQRTPFFSFHQQQGAKLVDFAGWEMPILYTSIHEEHHAVRNTGGMFDVSHMGRVKIEGRHARRFLERILTRRISDMADNTCRYSLICNEQGGVLDDVLIYHFADHWMLVVNASNRTKILDHLQANLNEDVVQIEDQTKKTAMVALQGPKVMEIVGQFSREVPTLKRYSFCTKNLLILKMIISRTGYTGEDGVEVILNASMASKAIGLLLSKNDEIDVKISPAGLGARDTLRLEAGMPLYGHELSETIDPISAGLQFAVSLDKGQEQQGPPVPTFIGQEALAHIAEQGPKQRLVGLKIKGKRTPRQGMKVNVGNQAVGEVTSGCVSPTLGYPIAMAYIQADLAKPGNTVSVQASGQALEAEIVKPPFYKRPRQDAAVSSASR